MASSRNKPSIDVNLFAQQVLERVLPHLPTAAGVPCRMCVGFSGGLDSTALLYAVRGALGLRGDSSIALSAIHVHHGLSPNADAWAHHCQAVCDSLNVPLQIHSVEVLPQAGEGIEAAARQARYGAYASLDVDLILLGHHQDDQAETLLHNLVRGASVLGAAAMPARRGRFLRPLLAVPRRDIRAYADSRGLSWVEDESNRSRSLSRNYLRLDILSPLNERFPGASANLARAADTFAEAQTLLDDLALLDGAGQVPLPVSVLKDKTQARALNALAYHLRKAGLRVASQSWLRNLLKQLLDALPDRQVRIPCDGKVIRRYQEHVIIEDAPCADLPAAVAWFPTDGPIPWGGALIRATATKGQGIARGRLGNTLEFRTRHGGDTFEVRPGLRRPLKDLMREARIPPWERHRLPVLVSDGELVWVPLVGIAEKYRCGAEEDGISLEFDEASW